jgi:CRP-like cAMP-binding protein
VAVLPDELRRAPLFRAVHPEELRSWAADSSLSSRDFAAGALVASRGDRCDRLLVLVAGSLDARMVDYSGRQLTIETLKAPTIVAGSILFATEATLPVQLVCEEPARLVYVPRGAILDLCRRSSEFLLGLLRDSGDRVSFLADRIRFLQMQTLRQKMAAHLLDLASAQATDVLRMPYSLERLAEVFGVARPSLSRTISELVDAGLVARADRGLRIRDRAGLERLLEEE